MTLLPRRVAVLNDIHGNLPALDAVLDDVRGGGFEQIVVGGDVVPGPMPREALDRVFSLGLSVEFVHGNGESAVLAQMAGREPTAVPERFRHLIDWTAAQLTEAHRERMSRWPLTLRVPIDRFGEVLFCHATPRNDTEIFVKTTADSKLKPIFEPLGVRLVVCGHTHMQFDRMVGQTRIVNAGSVGMPFGEPGAYWLAIGPDVELRRTSYDLTSAAHVIRATSYPTAEEFATKNVLEPPSEAEMLAAFARAEVGG
jgi:predicted phosphodiesterase